MNICFTKLLNFKLRQKYRRNLRQPMGYSKLRIFRIFLNKWIKMAACLLFIEVLRENEDKALRRERVFRDRSQVLDMLTDSELIGRYRFPRRVILQLTDDVKNFIQPQTLRSHAIPAHIQVFLWIWLNRGNLCWLCSKNDSEWYPCKHFYLSTILKEGWRVTKRATTVLLLHRVVPLQIIPGSNMLAFPG